MLLVSQNLFILSFDQNEIYGARFWRLLSSYINSRYTFLRLKTWRENYVLPMQKAVFYLKL